jgi:hypothetical protein
VPARRAGPAPDAGWQRSPRRCVFDGGRGSGSEVGPRPRERLAARELLDPEYIALRSVFRVLHALAGRAHPRYPYPRPAPAARRRIERALGLRLTSATNDGVVPTLSQIHGRLLHVAHADHLDVVGHYTLAGGRTADWLPSGAGFTTESFEATWDAVAAAIARGERARD